MWTDRRQCFRVERMMERDGMFETYDISLTPTLHYTPEMINSIISDAMAFQFGGLIDDTYFHVDILKIDLTRTRLKV